MRNIGAICRREFAGYFTTPIGYVVAGIYAVIVGLGFATRFIYYAWISQAPATHNYTAVPDFEEWMLSPFLIYCGLVILFIGPLVTMRLMAEEKNRGTIELLLTYPLRDREIILGKYLAALGMLAVLIVVAGVNLAMLLYFTEVEPVVLLFGLLTVFLMGAAFVSMGLFASSLCSNQVTAGSLTLGFWLAMYILGSLAEDLPATMRIPEGWPGPVANAASFVYAVFKEFVQALPLDAHAEDLAQGIVQPQDIAYYLLFAAFFLFLTFRVLESRKWRA